MNRVRLVAITAVALGGAVVAGTQFQQSQQPATSAPAQAALSVVPLATASVSATPSPTGTSGQPTLLATAEPPRAAPDPGTSAPRLATASILPQVDLPAAPSPEAAVTPMVRGLAQLDVTATNDGVAAQPLDPQLQAELSACAVWLVVTPAAGAMLETSIYAPCDRDATVAITHAGLTFDTRIGGDGQMMVQIPALTADATVTVAFADGREQTDTTEVPDLAMMERVVLQWQGPAVLMLHAYEFGAQYGDPGHVFAGSAMAPGSDGTTPGHGFLTMLGDPALPAAHLAQVYSYPRGETPRSGEVALEIEVPVTDASCGAALEANAMEMHGVSSAQVRQIRLDMPACDGEGGYLVLPGVLPELQIALN